MYVLWLHCLNAVRAITDVLWCDVLCWEQGRLSRHRGAVREAFTHRLFKGFVATDVSPAMHDELLVSDVRRSCVIWVHC